MGIDGGFLIILVCDTACCGSTHAGIGVGFPIIPNTPQYAVALRVINIPQSSSNPSSTSISLLYL